MDSKRVVTEHVFRVDSGDMHVFLIVLPEGVTAHRRRLSRDVALIERPLERARAAAAKTSTTSSSLIAHPDHAGGLAEIKRATGAKVWMHAADADMVQRGQGVPAVEGGPGSAELVVRLPGGAQVAQQYEPAQVENEVRPGETIPLAGGIKAIRTPRAHRRASRVPVAGRRRGAVHRRRGQQHGRD